MFSLVDMHVNSVFFTELCPYHYIFKRFLQLCVLMYIFFDANHFQMFFPAQKLLFHSLHTVFGGTKILNFGCLVLSVESTKDNESVINC